jgi:hypothetical protein
VLGAISVTLRQNKALGVSGIAFALAAALLGGSQVPVDGELTQGPFLGLDWFLLSLMLYSATFVPLERLFALRPEQDVFRPAWRTDLMYFGMSALLLQLTTLLTMRPAMVFFDWAASARVQAWVAGQPGVVQFLEILALTDLCQYWIHHAFTTCLLAPRIHHSAGRWTGSPGATPPGGRGGDPRPDLRADLRARLRPGARRLRRLRQRQATFIHALCAEFGRSRGWCGRASTTGITASSEAVDVSRPPAGRLALRDVSPAGEVAVRLRRAVGSTGAGRLRAPVRAPVPPPASGAAARRLRAGGLAH